jgi:hypothetical protein
VAVNWAITACELLLQLVAQLVSVCCRRLPYGIHLLRHRRHVVRQLSLDRAGDRGGQHLGSAGRKTLRSRAR